MIASFFKNSFIYTIGTILTRGIAIILVPIYTRYLSPSEYGIIDLFVILTSIISLTIALEIHQAVVRFYQDTTSEEEKRQYVSTAFIFTVFVYSLYLIVSFLFSDIFTIWLLDEIRYENVFLLASGAIFTKGVLYFTHDQLKWQILPREFTIVSFVNVIIVAAIAVYLLVIEKMKIESIFIGQIVGNIIGVVLSISYSKKSYQCTFIFNKFKTMVSFSFPLVFSSTAIFIVLFIDRIAIKYFLGLEELGIYGLAYRFAAITSLVMIGFQSSLMPLVYKHYKEEDTPKNISKLFNLFSILALFIIIGSIFFSNELVIFMSTEDYYGASALIPLLVMSVFFSNMYIFSPGLSIAKKTKVIMIISFVNAIINAGLNFMLIPIYGLEGAAFSTLLSAMIIFVIRLKASNQYYKIPYTWEKLSLAWIFSLVSAYIVIRTFNEINMINGMIKLIILFIVLYIIVYLLIGKNNIDKVLKKFKVIK